MPPSDSARSKWTIADSAALYRIENWGEGYFEICPKGEVTVGLCESQMSDGEPESFSLPGIVAKLREQKIGLPVLLRFPHLLHSRIETLHKSFHDAIQAANYEGSYRGVYPIKVNQRAEVVKEITSYGRRFNYGLEVGTKTELVASLGYLHDPDAFIICNGYKDSSYINLALLALKMGLNVILVIEMPHELDEIVRQAGRLKVEPQIGIRYRLSMEGSGRWGGTSGEKGLFGLNFSQVIDTIDALREKDMLHCLKMLHYHQGSQLCDIAGIRKAAAEAARVYVSLIQEGAEMGYLNLGGGLAVDYDGSDEAGPNSKNYSVPEYCETIVGTLREIFNESSIPHPLLVSESGRGVAAYYSVLVFDILDVSPFDGGELPSKLPKGTTPIAAKMLDEVASIKGAAPDETGNIYKRVASLYQDVIRNFTKGKATLRDCAIADRINRFAVVAAKPDSATARDFYYGNFSVFQSLPDHWALEQFFPVMPLHRLNEEPTHKAVIADLTCDSDGKIKTYVHPEEGTDYLPVHQINEKDDYLLGAFLVGAYQETLGDMHNLFGTTHVVSVEKMDGELEFTRVVLGDTATEVLTYLEYNTDELRKNLKRWTEEAISINRISPKDRDLMLREYDESLKSYTYLGS